MIRNLLETRCNPGMLVMLRILQNILYAKASNGFASKVSGPSCSSCLLGLANRLSHGCLVNIPLRNCRNKKDKDLSKTIILIDWNGGQTSDKSQPFRMFFSIEF